ncbi:hypothetical protein SUGI_0729690 [Cryptomeria japonica]|uniref:berberine bridge enzyme-like D-2 n=1 Tax=Cryptomeria japonica TaxID=3369 RepID=UPI002414AFCB|nr:berberine bridge enzyme-like D-2 [Cryptomeria japonica]GLJ36350.1 hypothetical protein SUGI_0729690 [Cryptomeria japonica]
MFEGTYLGRKNELVNKIANSFPELQMESANCEEMSWIETIAYFDNNIQVSELTNRKPSNATPFPHRAGTLFNIHYNISWSESCEDDYYLKWMRDLYQYMEPYVSHSPRAAYINFLDLDLGTSHDSVEEARVWGEKYFGANFDRLVDAKTQVDPANNFNNPQSIPPRCV